MVCAPLVLQVVQFVDVSDEHIACEDFNTWDVRGLCQAEASAARDWRLETQGLIQGQGEVGVRVQVKVICKVWEGGRVEAKWGVGKGEASP